jgi:hypothetical protein
MRSPFHEQLCNDGWNAATECFWDATPCFYDLGKVKTVLLFRVANAPASGPRYADVYYWKHGSHDPPEYLKETGVELRQYKLHHSMNALLWYDHGDRGVWPV